MGKFIDLTGQRFGRLTVIRKTDKDKQGAYRWLCLCDCGQKAIVVVSSLQAKRTRSCGCSRTKHGHCQYEKNTGFYKSWNNMIQRCTNPNSKQYKYYGGREITVCEKWLNFPNFLRDMKKEWKSGLTIERKDNNKGYYLENCKWTTPKEQNRNKRNNVYIIYNGKTRLLIELCEKYNMPYRLVYERIYRSDWSPEKALTTLVGKYNKRKIDG